MQVLQKMPVFRQAKKYRANENNITVGLTLLQLLRSLAKNTKQLLETNHDKLT